MKKLLAVGLFFSLLVLGACGDVEKEEVTGTVQKQEDKAVEDNAETTEATNEESVAVDSQVVVDNEFVKITLTGIEKVKDADFGDEINVAFDVENKTSKTITVQAREVSGDGRMIDENKVSVSMSNDISAGKAGTATLELWDMEGAGNVLPELNQSLELKLNVFDAESYEDIGIYDVNVQF